MWGKKTDGQSEIRKKQAGETAKKNFVYVVDTCARLEAALFCSLLTH